MRARPPRTPPRSSRRPVVVCAPDSFKGSLSAVEAAAAMARGIEENLGLGTVEVRRLPLADGGEGTVEALVEAVGGVYVETDVTGPLGEPLRARWGLLDEGATAVIEMAAAAGLPLVPADRRNPLRTTTFGVGQLIAAALDRPGVRRILIGVGGSATCDGGIGMAQALGARFKFTPSPAPADAARPPRVAPPSRSSHSSHKSHNSHNIPGPHPFLVGGDCQYLAAIDLAGMDPRLKSCDIEVLCDVTNPLVGPHGAAAEYGPQKGASPDDVIVLERGLGRLAGLWRSAGLGDFGDAPGAGAAGGLAAGLMAFCGARIAPGIERVLDAVGFDRALAGADLVLTGEGAFNRQSLSGKVVSGVARRCRAAGLPVVVLAGSVKDGPEARALVEMGLAGLFSLVDGPMTEAEAMERAAELTARRAGWIARLFLVDNSGRRADGPSESFPGDALDNE